MLKKNLLRQLDLQDLAVFLCIYKHRSVRSAAEILHISSPTVSYCLKRLRACFNDALFDSTHGAMRPTPKADAIAPYIHNVVDAINRCVDPDNEHPATIARKIIRICAPEYFELLLLPSLLEKVTYSPIESTLHIERLGRELPIERLLANEMDLSIGFGPGYHRLHPELQWESVIEDTFVCLVSCEREEPGEPLSADEFCAAQHIFPTPWVSEKNMVDSWLEKLGRSRTIIARANTYQACINIAAKLPVMLALPRRLVPLLPIPDGVTICEPPLGFPSFTLDIIWSARRDGCSEIEWIRELLKESASRSD